MVRARVETGIDLYRIVGDDGSESPIVDFGKAVCVATSDGIIYGQMEHDDDAPRFFLVKDQEPIEVTVKAAQFEDEEGFMEDYSEDGREADEDADDAETAADDEEDEEEEESEEVQ